MRSAKRPYSVLLLFTIACVGSKEQPSAPELPPPSFAKAPPSPPPPTVSFLVPLADAGLAVKSDGLYGDGTWSRYTNGICGVTASIFEGGSGDAVMQTNNPTAANRKCADAPRKWTLVYDDGVVEIIPVFVNLHEIQNSTYSIPVGATVKRRFGINPTQNTRCDRLVWGEVGDSALVTRTGTNTLEVQSQEAPNDRAFCSTTGVLHHMALRFTIVRQ